MEKKGRGRARETERGKGIKRTAMAPHRKGSDAELETMVAQVEKHPISSILIIIG